MADIEWLPAWQLREIYVDPVATDIPDAQRRLYLAVVTGEVRARLRGRPTARAGESLPLPPREVAAPSITRD
jgi:hypothetical protein